MNSRRYGRSHPRSGFTPEEDCLLLDLVSQYGRNSWVTVSSYMENRNARQCKDRYMSYLSPTINNGPYTEEEDKLLNQKYEELGPKWVKISKFFHNRTDISVKCRWAVLNRRKMKINGEQINVINSSPSDDSSKKKDSESVSLSSIDDNPINNTNNIIRTRNTKKESTKKTNIPKSEIFPYKSKMSLRKRDTKHYNEDDLDDIYEIDKFYIFNQNLNTKVSNKSISDPSKSEENTKQIKENEQEKTEILTTLQHGEISSNSLFSDNSNNFNEVFTGLNKSIEEKQVDNHVSEFLTIGTSQNHIMKTENKKNDFINIFSNSFNGINDKKLNATEEVLTNDLNWDFFVGYSYW